MIDPNANIIIRRKIKSKAKTGRLYLELMRLQISGDSMAGEITKKCREMKLEPIKAMKGIRKYLTKTNGKSYKLSFDSDILDITNHYIEEYELLNSLKKSDKNIILAILMHKYHDR